MMGSASRISLWGCACGVGSAAAACGGVVSAAATWSSVAGSRTMPSFAALLVLPRRRMLVGPLGSVGLAGAGGLLLPLPCSAGLANFFTLGPWEVDGQLLVAWPVLQ